MCGQFVRCLNNLLILPISHSISMPPQSLTVHQPNFSIAGAPPMGSMATQTQAPPPYQPASLYQPHQTLVQQPLL